MSYRRISGQILCLRWKCRSMMSRRRLASSLATNSTLLFCVFFFQAEDGIRDLTVTGVQTCALPIWQGLELFFFPQLRTVLEDVLKQSPDIACFRGLRGCVKQLLHAKRWSSGCQQLNEIGRASCRERV